MDTSNRLTEQRTDDYESAALNAIARQMEQLAIEEISDIEGLPPMRTKSHRLGGKVIA